MGVSVLLFNFNSEKTYKRAKRRHGNAKKRQGKAGKAATLGASGHEDLARRVFVLTVKSFRQMPCQGVAESVNL